MAHTSRQEVLHQRQFINSVLDQIWSADRSGEQGNSSRTA